MLYIKCHFPSSTEAATVIVKLVNYATKLL